MKKNYELNDIILIDFMHAAINQVFFEPSKKIFCIKFDALNLKEGGCLYECNITMSNWLDFEVIEVGKKVYKKYLNEEIPTNIFQIFKYQIENDILTFISCGTLDIDTQVRYIFTKPKIEIDGEYDPD